MTPVSAQDAAHFISVVPDDDYKKADEALEGYLERATGMRLDPSPKLTYYNLIAELVSRGESGPPYVARVTPYAYVAAELQGAQFEVLATYQSKATKNETTYHSYFVVRTDGGYTFSKEPTLSEVTEFLKVKGQPRTFVYHDKFSTSSYFVPSLYFRSQGVFQIEPGQPPGDLFPVTAKHVENAGSSDLVKMVASGEADIAAVWDGTKAKFPAENWPNLRFVQLDVILPNDLLVCWKGLSTERKNALKRAIADMRDCAGGKPAFAGDFTCWTDIVNAPDARRALSGLGHAAIAPPAPVTVEISLVPPNGVDEAAAKVLYAPYKRAAEQAIKFAGTEFVVYDPDYHHQTADVVWKIEPIHDGAVKLTSSFAVKDVGVQVFPLSFSGVGDLSKRIEGIIHTQLHRIRYIWPYDNQVPTIIRDVSFAPSAAALAVQKIVWSNPVAHKYTTADEFDAGIKKANDNEFQLDPQRFPRSPKQELLGVDPLSNVAYRVVLTRPTVGRPLFRNLTAALVLLFFASGVLAIVDLVRRRRMHGAEVAEVGEGTGARPAPALRVLPE